jgi:hypothetical protein
MVLIRISEAAPVKLNRLLIFINKMDYSLSHHKQLLTVSDPFHYSL